MKILYDKLNIWKRNTKTMKHQHNAEIEQLKYKIKATEEQIQKSAQHLKEKEKEIEIAKMKIQESSKGIKNNSLVPLISYDTDRDIEKTLKKKKEYRTTGKSAPLKPTAQAISFDDSALLPANHLYRIKALYIFSKDANIVGIQALYFLKDKQEDKLI